MKRSLTFPCRGPLEMLLLFCGLLAFPGNSIDAKQKIAFGHWRILENYNNKSGAHTSTWDFELVEDGGPTTIAVGRRLEADGKPRADRSIAVLFLDIHEDGSLSGTYIEAFGDGKQIELSVDVDVELDGKEIRMAAFDRNGSITSRFKGEWLGKGLVSHFQSGAWEVREIVSPDKGSWDIEWKFQLKDSGKAISGRGQKSIVNGRKAFSGEAKTKCDFSLTRGAQSVPPPGNTPQQVHPNSLIGKGVETSAKGKKSQASYEGWLSPSGKTFFLMSYEADGLAALMVGRFGG